MSDLKYFGSVLTNKSLTTTGINAKIASGNKTTAALHKLLIYKALPRKEKMRIYNTIIKPVVIYSCEAWWINLADQKRLSSFENRIIRIR